MNNFWECHVVLTNGFPENIAQLYFSSADLFLILVPPM